MRISGWRVTLFYTAATVVMTWPVARGLTRDLPNDLGDPLLNCWILSWVADHLLQALRGDVTALGRVWHANIFYPEPYALAYSEHLAAQAIQILPVYAVTWNPILCYNLLFLSTFILSGLGMFLLVRALTADAAAALAAGAFYAFALPRVGHIPHLQVLSMQWMPFALLGLHRFFETRRAAPLAGASAALIAQNLSCGYYLMFFTPCVAAVALFEIWTRRLWRDRRTWKMLVAAAAAVAVATLPFLMPYLRLRQFGGEPRRLAEIIEFSADVYSYFTAAGMLTLWGDSLRPVATPEGELFPSWTVMALSVMGLGAAIAASRRTTADARVPQSALRRRLAQVFLGIAVVYGALIPATLLLGGFRLNTTLAKIDVHNVQRLIATLAIALLAFWALSPRAFARMRLFAARREALYAVLIAGAAFLSLGPRIKSRGRVFTDGPYELLYKYVPGFDGLRSPGRLGLIVCLFLAILAGMGVAVLRRRGGLPAGFVPVIAAVFFVEAAFLPLPMNEVPTPENPLLNPPSQRVYTAAEIPEIYEKVRQLPARAVLVEFPFGEIYYDIRYLYYSIFHRRPLVNGYSGSYPVSYQLRSQVLAHPPFEHATAWNVLLTSGATHAIVHRAAYPDADGERMVGWLRDHGAAVLADTGDAALLELPARDKLVPR